MKPMVVLFAVMAVACGSPVPLAQPPHHPAIVLDPHGRPLDTAEVINARALHLQATALEGHHGPLVAPLAHSLYAAPLAHAVAPAVVAAPVAVSHQSRVDVRTSPAVVTSHVAPVLGHSLVASPLLGLGHGLSGHGHYLKKRSLGLLAHSVPLVAAAPAVSHQSRVDVISSPAVVSHAVAAPVLAHAAPVLAYAAPAVKYVGGSAVSHQSRVDVQSSPAVVSHSVVAAPLSHGLGYAAPLSHGLGYAAPLAHGLGYAAPLAHGLGYAAPYAHSGLLHTSPLAHAW